MRTPWTEYVLWVGLDARPIKLLFSDVNKSSPRPNILDFLAFKVQVMDSHRSIAEPEKINRLTEVAFLFIPLSFATIYFGLLIIDAATPASTYIAVARILRFIIHWMTQCRMIFVQDIRNKITVYRRLITRFYSRDPLTWYWPALHITSYLLSNRPHSAEWFLYKISETKSLCMETSQPDLIYQRVVPHLAGWSDSGPPWRENFSFLCDCLGYGGSAWQWARDSDTQ